MRARSGSPNPVASVRPTSVCVQQASAAAAASASPPARAWPGSAAATDVWPSHCDTAATPPRGEERRNDTIRAASRQRSNRTAIAVLTLLLMICATCWLDSMGGGLRFPTLSPMQLHVQPHLVEAEPRALLLYVWSNNDRNYLDNMRDFIERVVAPRRDSNVDYVFLLNQDRAAREWNPHIEKEWPGAAVYVPHAYLPPLPAGSIYLDHPNECFDSGTWGWFFSLVDHDHRLQELVTRGDSEQPIATTPAPAHWNATVHASLSFKFPPGSYRYYMLMNASVRGPFLPAYINLDKSDERAGQLVFPWYTPFLHLMHQDPDVKLAGATASCEGQPHVQSYFLFTDQVGMSLIRSSPALACHRKFWDAVLDGEIGISKAILDAGWNIAALHSSQQGAEFRTLDSAGRVLPASSGVARSHYCHSSGHNPTGWKPVDGVSLNMFDVVFVKWQQKTGQDPAVAKHQQWQRDTQARRDQSKARRRLKEQTSLREQAPVLK